MVRVEDAGIEPALLESSATVEPAVEVLGVLRGDVLEQTADAAFHQAGVHEMKVVGHEDVAMNENATFVGVMVEQGEELAAVLVGEKDGLPVISTLGDVEGIVRGSESWFARHSLDKWISPPIRDRGNRVCDTDHCDTDHLLRQTSAHRSKT